MKYPDGKVLSGKVTRWDPSEVHEWEQAHGLNLPPLTGMPDVRQLAKRYGVHPTTVWRWCARGRKEVA